MSLTSGTRLGSYEILGAIGAGGMGEVYRARDTQLNRDVAIKVLPALFALDAERLARFTREAQTLAALNHPNIAQIYGLEASAGNTRALVMELVDGDDLSVVIERGPMLPAEVLPIARQIAEALEAAHELGIIHRDLKPANIKVRSDGTVKILDFGLAKAMDPSKTSSADAMQSPTLTARATQMGMIIGTAAYMAPEQAKGKAVDKRADIWAFGVVLYEMLTGRRAFDGDDISTTMAAVLMREPDLAALSSGTPVRVRALIARCLVKDPKLRLRDIGDARLMLDEKEEVKPEVQTVAARAARPPFPARLLLPTAILMFLLAAVAVVTAFLTKSQPEIPSVHLSIALPPGEQVTAVPAISADGRTIAYAAGRTRETSRLYLRAIDSFTARAVDSSGAAQMPFFSPDGRSVAFFASGKLWRAVVTGGAPTPVASAPRPWGGTWCSDGTIVYVPNLNSGLWRVPENGGTAVQLTKPDGAAAGYGHTYPQRLPGTDDLLFSFWGQTFYTAVLSSKTGTWRAATPGKSIGGAPAIGVYAENGYVLAGDGAAGVTAASWNPSITTPRHPETVVIDSVYWVVGNERTWFNVSADGTAVYAPGSPLKRHLVWVDRKGDITQFPGEADSIKEATLSRDGQRVVRSGRLSQWVEDLVRGTRTRILSDSLTWHGGWLPGDDRIVVSSNKEGDWDLYTVSANGNGDMKPLLKKPFTQHPMSVAPDGSVLYYENHPITGLDLWILTSDGRTRPLAVTPFNEVAAAVSPDSAYVAYFSDESGRNEVYAMPLSGRGNRVTVSTDGGTGPVWSRDGRELFYRAGDDLISVEVRSTSPLVLGNRRKLLDVSGFEPGYFHDFDVSADGQRFLFIRAEPGARPTRIDVILNWFPELKRRAEK
jgi:Tol biopolymer transport system component